MGKSTASTLRKVDAKPGKSPWILYAVLIQCYINSLTQDTDYVLLSAQQRNIVLCGHQLIKTAGHAGQEPDCDLKREMVHFSKVLVWIRLQFCGAGGKALQPPELSCREPRVSCHRDKTEAVNVSANHRYVHISACHRPAYRTTLTVLQNLSYHRKQVRRLSSQWLRAWQDWMFFSEDLRTSPAVVVETTTGIIATILSFFSYFFCA